MATTLFTIYQNTYGTPILWTLYQSNGTTPYDLTGSTVTLYVWRDGNASNPIISGACAVYGDAANGQVTYTPTAADLISKGTFTAEFKALKSGAYTGFGQFQWEIKESP